MTEHASPGWEHAAACKGHDPEAWFPVAAVESPDSSAREARRICGGCPVRVDCARSVSRQRAYGIWGGFRLDERTEINERRALEAFVEAAPALLGVV